MQRLAGAPKDKEHAAAALLGENPLLLQLGPRSDHIVAGRQAVAQRYVFRRECVDLIREQIDGLLLRRDHGLEVARGRVERRPEAVRQVSQVLDALTALSELALGLPHAGDNVAQFGDQRVARCGDRALARHVEPAAHLHLRDLYVDVAEEPRAQGHFLH